MIAIQIITKIFQGLDREITIAFIYFKKLINYLY